MNTYTAGFLFDYEAKNVVLAIRERPEELTNAWSAIGGELKDCEHHDFKTCHAKKFYNDSGVITPSGDWIQFMHLHWKGTHPGEVYFFKQFTDLEILKNCEDVNEDREIRVWDVYEFMTSDAKAVHNLKWILCAALTDRGSYYSIEAFW